MLAEASLIVAAGSETTGYALSYLHFHLLNNPEKLQKLKSELPEAMPDRMQVPDWLQLRKLPYLVGTYSAQLKTLNACLVCVRQ